MNVKFLPLVSVPLIQWDLLMEAEQGPILGFGWTAEDLHKEAQKNQNGIGIIDESQQKLIGLLIWKNAGDTSEVIAFYVGSKYRGLGLGISLFIEARRSEPSPCWWLEVHEANIAALSLYNKLGFVPVGRRADYYRDGGAAILMEWKEG